MTRRDRMLLTILAPLLVVVALWMLVLSPKISDLGTANDNLAAAKATLEETQAKLLYQQASRSQLTGRRKSLVAAGRALPPTSQTPDLLRQLQRVAERTGVEISSLTPGTATPGAAGAQTIPLQMSIAGSYNETQAFMRGLNNLVHVSKSKISSSGRLVSVSSVQLSKGEGNDLNGTVSASVYTFNGAPQSDPAASTTSTTSSTEG